jgi:predicted transcriptional regulator
MRRVAIAEMVRHGWSYSRIADELGLSKAAISKHAHEAPDVDVTSDELPDLPKNMEKGGPRIGDSRRR